MVRVRVTVSLVLVAFVGLVAIGCGATRTNDPNAIETDTEFTLNGEGATFVEPIMKVWSNEYSEKSNGKATINYQGKGSGAGISQMTKKLADFGCSDAPMNKKQLDEASANGGAVVHIPLVIGAVVPMYNLPADVSSPVHFTGPVLADIFMGKITKWNDAKLKELNPGVNLPDLAIQPVYRADPSGTSFIFADYLSKVSPECKTTVGVSTTPNWPTGVGIKQNKSDGMAGHIGRTLGAIGYIELTFALGDKKVKYGTVKNRTGKQVLADLDSITSAATASLGAKQTVEPYSLHDLTYNLTDADGDNSYPIAGMSFAVIYQKQAGVTGRGVVTFLKWVTSTEGQFFAKRRNYAPLPEALQKQIDAKLAQVEITK